MQTFSSPVSDVSDKPTWSAGRNLVLQKGEATVARIAVTSIVKSGRVRSTTKRQLVGCCPESQHLSVASQLLARRDLLCCAAACSHAGLHDVTQQKACRCVAQLTLT